MKFMEIDVNCGYGTLHIFGEKVKEGSIIRVKPPCRNEREELNKLIQTYNDFFDPANPMKNQKIR